jgi:hypothetical protein
MYFWVGCGWFFLGGRGRGRGNSRSRTVESFFAGRHESPNSPFLCYILYIEQWEFRCIKFQSIAKSALDLDTLGRRLRCSSVDKNNHTKWDGKRKV